MRVYVLQVNRIIPSSKSRFFLLYGTSTTYYTPYSSRVLILIQYVHTKHTAQDICWIRAPRHYNKNYTCTCRMYYLLRYTYSSQARHSKRRKRIKVISLRCGGGTEDEDKDCYDDDNDGRFSACASNNDSEFTSFSILRISSRRAKMHSCWLLHVRFRRLCSLWRMR